MNGGEALTQMKHRDDKMSHAGLPPAPQGMKMRTPLSKLSFPTFLIGNPVSLLVPSFVKTRDGTQAVPYKILRE